MDEPRPGVEHGRSRRRLGHLYEVVKRLAGARRPAGDLEAVLAIVGRELSARCIVALFQVDDALHARSWCGTLDDPLGRVAAEADARAALARLMGAAPAAAAPAPAGRVVEALAVDGQVIGALQLDGPALDVEDRAFVSAIARQLSVVLGRPGTSETDTLRRLLAQRARSPVGQLTLSPAGEVLDLNDTAADLLAVDERAVGRPLSALVVDEDAPDLASHLAAALAAAARPPDLEVTPRWQRDRRLLLTTRQARDERGQAVCFAALLDVSARARERAALRLLASTSSAATLLDPDAVVARLCRLVVPSLADLSVADLLADGRRLARRAHVCHVDPDRGRRFQRAEERWGVLPNVAFAALEALRDGRVVRLGDVGPRYMQLAAVDADHLAAVVGLALRSWLLVPLIDPVHGAPLGVLRLATSGTRRPFDDADVAIGEDLARVGGTALANARAHARMATAAGAPPRR